MRFYDNLAGNGGGGVVNRVLFTENVSEFLFQLLGVVAAGAAENNVPRGVDDECCRETRNSIFVCHICGIVQYLTGMSPSHVVFADELL